MARPKKSDRYSAQTMKITLRELCADALDQMRHQIKGGKVDYQSLSNFVMKALPIIIDDNTENANDVTMDMLIKKVIKVNMRIQEANEEGLKEDEEDITPAT